MASPKTMPMTRIGMKLMIGAGSKRPKSPSWKTRTVRPRVASTESRKPIVAVSGTSTERNTIMSRMNASPTTMAR